MSVSTHIESFETYRGLPLYSRWSSSVSWNMDSRAPSSDNFWGWFCKLA